MIPSDIDTGGRDSRTPTAEKDIGEEIQVSMVAEMGGRGEDMQQESSTRAGFIPQQMAFFLDNILMFGINTTSSPSCTPRRLPSAPAQFPRQVGQRATWASSPHHWARWTCPSYPETSPGPSWSYPGSPIHIFECLNCLYIHLYIR